jgi:hypothetical protein
VVVAKAQTGKLVVKKVQTSVNADDFDDILATGDIPSILGFMKTKNLQDPKSTFNFRNVYWLCKDQTFFKEGINILKSKGIFNREFWAYSIHHLDEENMKEYFSCAANGLKKAVGSQFNSKLI